MEVLVTGGHGFIGSNLTLRLINDGHKVTVIDYNDTPSLPALREIPAAYNYFNINLANFIPKIKNIDVCFHLSATGSVQRSMDFPGISLMNNINSLIVILDLCRKGLINRVVHASSSSVYGGNDAMRVPILYAQKSPYALSKMVCEQLIHQYHTNFNIDYIILRYFNVFGPGQDNKSVYSAVIPKFIKAALTNKNIDVYGDGSQSRDFTFVNDVVEANILSMDNKAGLGRSYDIGSEMSYSINNLISIIENILRIEFKINKRDKREGDIMTSRAFSYKASELLKFKTSWNFEDAIRETIKYYKGW